MFSCKAENVYDWYNSNFRYQGEMHGIYGNSIQRCFVVAGSNFAGKQWENQVPISDFLILF